MGTKSRETIYGASVRAAAERAAAARKEADKLACEAWNKRMLGFQGPAQPSPALGDAINAGYPVTNIRNTSSPHWRAWLMPENRCLVPANSFAEYAPEPNPKTKKKDVVWFALDDDRPLFAFGGIWTEFKRRARHEIQASFWPAPRLRLPDDGSERRCRADPSEGDAGHPDYGRRARRLDACVVG